MLIKVNGRDTEIAANIYLHDLVSEKRLAGRVVILELNGAIIPRELWESTRLSPGDRLEVVRIIGGG